MFTYANIRLANEIFHRKNQYEVIGSVAKVYFRNCEECFLCDLEDLHYFVDNHTWFKNNDGYARAYINGKCVLAHVYLLGKQEGMEIDHKNRNKLDNRRENLHFVTHTKNMRNTSATIKKNVGVWKKKNRFVASIHIGDKTIHLGSFLTFEEARRARKEAEVFYWGKQV